MLDNWQRLERVIKWTGLSVNSFALTIGLKRSENLYQIKKGNNGISRDLAELITTKYPTVSKGWLLTGEGDIFIDSGHASSREGIPFYAMDAVEALQTSTSALPEPRFMINLPIFSDCDIATFCLGNTMLPEIPSGSIVLLKQWSVSTIIPGESYVILSPRFNGIRVIRQADTPNQLLLLARNTEEYDPIIIDRNKISKLYIVRGIITKKVI